MSTSAKDVTASRDGLIAALCSTLLIAQQVGGKATRDALFLSVFNVSALPNMLILSAVMALVSIPLFGRAMTKLGPSRLVPVAFIASAALLAGEWFLAGHSPRAGAVAVFLHIGSMGSILISWFWSLINERFDPRTAKQHVARIAGGATLGGLLGGLVAARLAKTIGVAGMLPVLAGLHLVCGGLTLALRSRRTARPAAPAQPERATLSLIWKSSYIRHLALLVSLSAIGAALIDYVFKAQATAAYGKGPALLRLFGIFYTATNLSTLALQSALTRRFLARFGIGKTVSMLPLTLGVGSAAALAVPSLLCVAIARGAEAAMRNSLFRSGYELLYTPIPPAEKRATKAMVDVGGERIGDFAGGGLVKLALFTLPGRSVSVLVLGAIALGVLGVILARHLQRGYVTTLERSLLERRDDVALSDDLDQLTRSVVLKVVATQAPPGQRREKGADPTVDRITALQSGDGAKVRAALEAGPIAPAVAPHVIQLLAWDEMAPLAINVLQKAAPQILGQLTDALLDPQSEFSVRRRIPRVLAAVESRRAADGLLAALEDQRFEVRYQSGRALSRIRDRNATMAFPADVVSAAVLRELSVNRAVWEGRQLLDSASDAPSPFDDVLLRDRANRSLEHVFNLLSLMLTREPLIIAYRGLYTDDVALRGTSLEYLETVLPDPIRESLWPFLEPEPKTRPTRPREQVIAELLRSRASIDVNLSRQIRSRSLLHRPV